MGSSNFEYIFRVGTSNHNPFVMVPEFTGISISSSIRFGKACIAGTRIAVADVLGWFAGGMTEQEILEDFPQLSAEQLREALAYAAARENRGTGILHQA